MKWPASKRPSARATNDEIRARVRRGYHPDTVLTQIGRPVRISFRREESSPCSERVVFADFGVVAALPQRQDVTVELRPVEAGGYEFTRAGRRCCVRRLIVAPGAEEPAGAA